MMFTTAPRDEREAAENAESMAKMEEILDQQADVNVLRPVGSRKFRDWRSVPKIKYVWPNQNENDG